MEFKCLGLGVTGLDQGSSRCKYLWQGFYKGWFKGYNKESMTVYRRSYKGYCKGLYKGYGFSQKRDDDFGRHWYHRERADTLRFFVTFPYMCGNFGWSLFRWCMLPG